jgi:hypothetical protein
MVIGNHSSLEESLPMSVGTLSSPDEGFFLLFNLKELAVMDGRC